MEDHVEGADEGAVGGADEGAVGGVGEGPVGGIVDAAFAAGMVFVVATDE